MSWARGKNNDGLDVGYAVSAVCDESECKAKIDRGLAHLCGDLEADTFGGIGAGCGGYFCEEHLFLGFEIPHSSDKRFVSVCGRCADERYDEDAVLLDRPGFNVSRRNQLSEEGAPKK